LERQADMTHADFEIRYACLAREHEDLCFPCDCCGHVELDALSPQDAENYLFARAMVGRDYALPAIVTHQTPAPLGP
jgi:hypothetical protein